MTETNHKEILENFHVEELTLEEADETIVNSLERIERNGGVRGGKPTVLRTLNTLSSIAHSFGLSPEQLSQLLDIILIGKIDDTTTRKLIRLLLPRQHVPEMCAIKVMGCLGRRLAFSNQAALLRWMIVVYNVIDSRTKLQRLYGVAFHYLSYETLRTPLCHLLYYMTRREDVKPYRIRKLMDLQMTVGKEPVLVGLLHVYKSYFPDLILAPLTISNRTIFKCPDQPMSILIMGLQEKWSHLNQGQETTLVASKAPIVRSGVKRQKTSHTSLPDAYSIYRKGDDIKAIPLSQITSLNSLVKHIDTLALPDQLSSVLSNRVLQHVLCLQPSQSVVERISYWLGQELMDLWYWREKTNATKARFEGILSKVVEITAMIKDLLPIVEQFLMSFLRIWNGEDHQRNIFTLLTYLRPRSYEELHVHFLKPLHRLFYFMGPVWKGELILCYRKLLQRWAQFKWNEYLEVGRNPRLSKEGLQKLRRLFSALAPNVDYMGTIRALIGHVDSISSVALEMEHDHIAVQHAVLSFFDFTSSLSGVYKVPLAVIFPHSTIVYRCFLSDSGMALSRICGIVYQYKQAFESFEKDQQLQYELLVQSQMSTRKSDTGDDNPAGKQSLQAGAALPAPFEVPGYNREYVVLFNSFVMDICNFLWRNRAFNKTDKNALGFSMDHRTITQIKRVCADAGLNMNNMMSITHSIAMSGYSARFLKSLEEQNNIPEEKRLRAPASSSALKDMVTKGGLNMKFDEFRVQYLDHLEQNGFEGISQFLFDSITALLQRKLQSQ
ncbi:Mis6-domain-containing protein [Lobosporangium transversale]|uniref:Mis6-domain-containing protein n=1 Tax=Lobosporangium transversale TaxID=64571 RepID=A0A1Y2GF20_9FUNG|nr:Mis6-domain-containing protein [Lobosporangium transversale]ORZ09055.1 Mis6-domain-containing protein [Lobosporangium transversale]|eukprot:XP_021878682.1 Mis6-domain-containing protein [Lobosporangium transversale]